MLGVAGGFALSTLFFLQTWGDLSNVFVSISPHKFHVKDETRRALCVQSL